MYRIVLLLTAIGMIADLAVAQRCYTDVVVYKKRQDNPSYAAELDARLQAMQQWAQPPDQSGNRRQVYTIPIVFHVVLNSQSLLNSVTDAEIIAQLETLNKDFRKLNADTTSIRSIFKPLAADIEIQFCLATRDPNGNGTTGITRTLTTHGPWDPDTETDDMKFTSSGGINAWNPSKYVNVWIVDIVGSQFGGTAGYAYIGSSFIHGDPEDGIVLDFQLGFGPSDRSLTHEMGHYLGLYHIWGTSGGCSNDDGISDTPVSASANYGCNYSTNSCNTGAGDLPDMIENYMDYSYCPAMFTLGQKTVMLNVLTGARASLINSNNGCQAINAAPATDFYASFLNVCPGTQVSFRDNSANNPTSWQWSFPGAIPSSSTQQNPTVTYNTPGSYSVTLTTTNAFGSDTETKTNYITVGTGATEIILSENFESSLTGWSVLNPDNSITWEVVTVSGNYPGNKAARVNIYNYNSVGQRDGLISPVFSLAGKSSARLELQHAHRRYSSNEHDSLIIYVSTNGGTTFPYRVYANAENGTGSFATGYIIGNVDFVPTVAEDWCFATTIGASCPSIDLSAFDGMPNLRLKFETYNDYGNNIYIDNIQVTAICTAPGGQAPVSAFTANTTGGCGSLTVQFTDQSTGNPSSWNWQFPGGNPSSSSQQNPVVTYSAPGQYDVQLTVSNTYGSNATSQNDYIIVHPLPSVSLSKTDASCPGVNDGSASASVSGGTPPYSFLWSNNSTSSTVTNLNKGSHAVTVTDANGCSVSQSIIVDAGPGVSISSFSVTPDSAGLATGSISVTVTGGSPPYAFLWSNGATTPALHNLFAGDYLLTVTDVNGCSATASFSVSYVPDNTVGISHLFSDNLVFSVFPNPSSGKVYISLHIPQQNQLLITFYEQTGRQLSSETIHLPAGQHTLPLPDVPTGLYLLKIKTQAFTAVTRIVVIR
ncbi:MAG: hypothetical protein KatS3mg031_2706 [Chitinophagales bacterium]|nr:MAG: hypothetical protein KatS3mg031_2706 [Chitinophagales bacterium]